MVTSVLHTVRRYKTHAICPAYFLAPPYQVLEVAHVEHGREFVRKQKVG